MTNRSETPTPRTDAFREEVNRLLHDSPISREEKAWQAAEDLERELQAANARCAELEAPYTLIRKRDSEISSLRTKLSEAKAEIEEQRDAKLEAEKTANDYYGKTVELGCELRDAKAEIERLQSWKESAVSVMTQIDFQEVAKALSVPLGESISKAILPGIERLKSELLSEREKVRELEKEVELLKERLNRPFVVHTEKVTMEEMEERFSSKQDGRAVTGSTEASSGAGGSEQEQNTEQHFQAPAARPEPDDASEEREVGE